MRKLQREKKHETFEELKKTNVAGTWRMMRQMAQNWAAEASRTMKTVLKLLYFNPINIF